MNICLKTVYVYVYIDVTLENTIWGKAFWNLSTFCIKLVATDLLFGFITFKGDLDVVHMQF